MGDADADVVFAVGSSLMYSGSCGGLERAKFWFALPHTQFMLFAFVCQAIERGR